MYTPKKDFSMIQGKKKHGFTLMELMIVIVILGCLSAVAIPKVSHLVEDARVAGDVQILSAVNLSVTVETIMGALNTAVENYKKEEGSDDNTIAKMDTLFFRVRLSDAMTKMALPDFYKRVEGAIYSAIKENINAKFVDLATGENSKEGVFRSHTLKTLAPSLLFLIYKQGSTISVCTLATKVDGSDSPVIIWTWRGRALAVGDVPSNGDEWAGVKFVYQELDPQE